MLASHFRGLRRPKHTFQGAAVASTRCFFGSSGFLHGAPRIASALLSIVLAVGAQHAFAQAGSLDLTFAPSSPIGAGKVRTAIGAGTDTARSVVIQPDIKIFVAGDCVVGSRLFFL